MNRFSFHLAHRNRSDGKRTGWVTVQDGARIYVETAGSGPPLVFVHGWTMSGGFWLHQMEQLSDRFKIIAMDLRAHGNSSKTLEGHTIGSYAQDLHGVMEALSLKNVVLAGWSLAGPVVLEYWHQFGGERLSALVLVEMTPFPFSPEEWNTHALKGYHFEGMHASFEALRNDRNAFGNKFIRNMFKKDHAPSEVLDWMFKEHMKTPTEVAISAYSDYVMGDYRRVLEAVSVPTLAVYGDSKHLCFGPKVGRYVAGKMLQCRLEILDQSGHMPFFEQPEKFNRMVAELVLRCR